ncbi:MAG: aldehyde ferredoxin oxidoreductase family protein [Chloroflexi bacterium]|nr:aldehyde ferredoxin oxidoreductase family protein [Chloroflexota bacterium]
MKFGASGKILRVNLSQKSIETEYLPESLYQLYPGGKALAGYFLLKEMQPGTDPFSPNNLLVFANGLLTGSPVSTATRFTVSARSPLTGGYGESEAGGFWGPELRNAGWDAILITGKAETPVYLCIQDDQISLQPAAHLWGQNPELVQSTIREETSEKNMRVLQIGLGGENLVRFAAITNELRHFNGRNGLGAVMGSKNLKAIAVRGNGRYGDSANDSGSLLEAGRQLAKQAKEHPLSHDLNDKGTLVLVGGLNASGMLPTHNFRAGAFDQVDKIKWEAYEKDFLTARRSCYACAVRCKREIAFDQRQTPSAYGGPEYEAVAAFGSNCCIDDLNAIMKANELCNIFTLDTISTGMTIAFAMECFEHGLIGLEDTDGIDLRFGNAAAMLQMIEKIARREGFGNILAEGSRSAARVIGGDAASFTVQVKGQELSMHDPRGKVAVGLGFAISEIGADHLVSYHDTLFTNPDSIGFKGAKPLGITDALPARDLSAMKVKNYFIGENWSSFEKAIGFCYFGPAPRSFIQVDDVVKIVNAATGWGISLNDLLRIGERATNLARIFNLREGFMPQDDRLPERLFSPSEAGPLLGVKIDHSEFDLALQELYNLKDWDWKTGVPSRQKLSDLEIAWASDLMEK